jgi:hypothetical protein
MVMQPISAKSLDLFTSRPKTWSQVYAQASLASLASIEIPHKDRITVTAPH